MIHYGLNDCTSLSNIIDIMNSLTPTSPDRDLAHKKTPDIDGLHHSPNDPNKDLDVSGVERAASGGS